MRLGLGVELVNSSFGEEDVCIGTARDEDGDKDGCRCKSEEAVGCVVDGALASMSFERICHRKFIAGVTDEIFVRDGRVLCSSVGWLVHEPSSEASVGGEEKS